MSKTPTLEDRAKDIIVAASALSQPHPRVSYVRGVTLEHLRAVEAETRTATTEEIRAGLLLAADQLKDSPRGTAEAIARDAMRSIAADLEQFASAIRSAK